MWKLVFTLVIFVPGCEKIVGPGVDSSYDVQEAILRTFMKDADRDTLFKYYFVAFVNLDTNNRIKSLYDPPESFVRRFSDIPVPVHTVSEMLFEPGRAVRHKATNQRAAMMWSSTVQFASISAAQATGGFICGGLCADTYRFHLTLQGNTWNVDSTDWLWSW